MALSKDSQAVQDEQLKETLATALKGGSEEEIAGAMTSFANAIKAQIIQEATAENAKVYDAEILQNRRGERALTSQETKYYNEVIAGEGFAGTETLTPPTVFERVFEDLVKSHELLSKISMQNTTALTEFIVKVGDIPSAWWGKLCAEHKELLDEGFTKWSMALYKLSAYIPVCKSMLTLGPSWLDRYVRTVLSEAMAIGLEQAIISGTGKDEPIGMMKDLAGAVVDGVYPDKATKAITDLSPLTIGTLIAPLTKGGKRKVTRASLIVNPNDYWLKIFPATTALVVNGEYKGNILPYPMDIIQSAEMPEGKAVFGLLDRYFMGIGMSQKVEVSDEYKFVEDERVYLAKLLGNGRPLDNDSFTLLDISGLEPLVIVGE